MIYMLLLGTVGLCLMFAIAAGYQEMCRLETQLELEKTIQGVPSQVLKAKSDAQQSTRDHVSEILDTQVSSLLTSANVQLGAICQSNPGPLTEATGILQSVTKQIKCINPSQYSQEILQNGIVAALQNLARRMTTAEFSVVIITDIGKLRMPRAKELFIYQSCAELIQNSIKHSNADICKVSIGYNDQVIKIRVIDNGINTSYNYNPSGLGLAKIDSRTNELGGQFDFELMAFGAQAEMIIPIAPSYVV